MRGQILPKKLFLGLRPHLPLVPRPWIHMQALLHLKYAAFLLPRRARGHAGGLTAPSLHPRSHPRTLPISCLRSSPPQAFCVLSSPRAGPCVFPWQRQDEPRALRSLTLSAQCRLPTALKNRGKSLLPFLLLLSLGSLSLFGFPVTIAFVFCSHVCGALGPSFYCLGMV